jgi:hypothetical protein
VKYGRLSTRRLLGDWVHKESLSVKPALAKAAINTNSLVIIYYKNQNELGDRNKSDIWLSRFTYFQNYHWPNNIVLVYTIPLCSWTETWWAPQNVWGYNLGRVHQYWGEQENRDEVEVQGLGVLFVVCDHVWRRGPKCGHHCQVHWSSRSRPFWRVCSCRKHSKWMEAEHFQTHSLCFWIPSSQGMIFKRELVNLVLVRAKFTRMQYPI